jgi:hypothetical protein
MRLAAGGQKANTGGRFLIFKVRQFQPILDFDAILDYISPE